MKEFVYSPAYSPDFGIMETRELAAQGLIYWGVPKGCKSRHFIGITNLKKIDKNALVHHLPNNKVNDPNCLFGKIKVSTSSI